MNVAINIDGVNQHHTNITNIDQISDNNNNDIAFSITSEIGKVCMFVLKQKIYSQIQLIVLFDLI